MKLSHDLLGEKVKQRWLPIIRPFEVINFFPIVSFGNVLTESWSSSQLGKVLKDANPCIEKLFNPFFAY